MTKYEKEIFDHLAKGGLVHLRTEGPITKAIVVFPRTAHDDVTVDLKVIESMRSSGKLKTILQGYVTVLCPK